MSLYAISWALAESTASGNDRLVVIVLAHHADDAGIAGCSKKTLATETRLSESTILRSQQALVKLGEIVPYTPETGPSWWLEIPANRRPKLFRMTGYLGSRFATPSSSGVSQGSHRGVSGVHDTPSDLERRDANYQTLERVNEEVASQISEPTGLTDEERAKAKAGLRALRESMASERVA